MLPPTQRRNASIRSGDRRGDTAAVHEAVQLGHRSCGASRRGNEGIFKAGDREGPRAHVLHVSRTVPLTVKLRGRTMRQAALKSNEALQARPMRPSGRRGRTISSGARGAKPQAHHGPLERLLEGLPPPPNKATQVTWHCLTARRRATPTSNETQRQTKPPRQNAPARAAAQRQRPRRRLSP